MILLDSVTVSGCDALKFKNCVIYFSVSIVGFVCTTYREFSAINIVGPMAIA